MKRRPFNLAAAVWLVLTLAIAALWVRSLWFSDRCINQYRRENTAHSHVLESSGGSITLASTSDERAHPAVQPFANLSADRLHYEHFVSPADPPDHWYDDVLGTFSGDRIDATDGQQNRLRSAQITFPHWLPVAAALIVPAVRFGTSVRAKRRRTSNRCRTCGYDLPAPPDRCPECGTPFGTSVAAKPAEVTT